jgi:hypothetical protein
VPPLLSQHSFGNLALPGTRMRRGAGGAVEPRGLYLQLAVALALALLLFARALLEVLG